MFVFLEFTLVTNRLGGLFTNSNNTLGILVSLDFASGTKYTLGIITTLVNYYVHFHNRNYNKKILLVSLGFRLSTNRFGEHLLIVIIPSVC